MPTKKVGKKGRGSIGRSDDSLASQRTSSKVEDVAKIPPQQIRTITVHFEYYENVVGLYPVADIFTKCSFGDEAFETSILPITDAERIEINEYFTFDVNVNSYNELDRLISTPAHVIVMQATASMDPNIYEQLVVNEQVAISPVKSYDSIVSIYEAITGVKVEMRSGEGRSKKKKGGSDGRAPKDRSKKSKEGKDKKSRKSTGSSGASRGGGRKKSIRSETNVEPGRQLTYGICQIDFVPLFHGNTSFAESLLIKHPDKQYDEKMPAYKKHPRIAVSVYIDEELHLPHSNILNMTVESIYNLPDIMGPDQAYVLCTQIPTEGYKREPILLTNPMYTTRPMDIVPKNWPSVQPSPTYANTTKYRVSSDRSAILNKVEGDVLQCMEEETPRLEFNMLRRILLSADGLQELKAHLRKYRRLVMEVYMTSKPKAANVLTDVRKLKNQQYLHLMVYMDLSALLYPGVTKVRLACPVRTFVGEEAGKLGGLEDSYFFPAPPKKEAKDSKDAGTKMDKPEKGKKEKSSKGSKSSKNSKVSKKSGATTDKSLKDLLPPKPEPPPPVEPSCQVYDEKMRRCFVIVEIEMFRPLVPKEDVEDLTERLYELLRPVQDKQMVLKKHLTPCAAKDMYKQTLHHIVQDLNEHYLSFVQECLSCKSPHSATEFVKFLQKRGMYNAYLTTITAAATSVVSTRFGFSRSDPKKHTANLKFVSDVFVHLVSEMNDAIKKLVCGKSEPIDQQPPPLDDVLAYAKEAAQLGNEMLADRYLMERICDDQQNADRWLDYAVFHLETTQTGLAFECVTKALTIDGKHKYGLLMMGLMLSEKEMKNEAETCLLNLMVHESKWLEGWVALHLFYEKHDHPEGVDMTLEMMQRYEDEPTAPTDYFLKLEDLLWSEKICPPTRFFRAACMFLKLRLYDWAEYALAHEMQEHYGIVSYMLAAIGYYKRFYGHALEHILEAEEHLGIDCVIGSLHGHILAALKRYKEARDQYYHVLESFERPSNVRLVNLMMAEVLEVLGEDQEARKFILLACKYYPSPYSWLRAGELYYHQNDLLSAEECFNEANLRDNKLLETWAYLCLINLKLNRTNEAIVCYNQLLQNHCDMEFLTLVQREMEKLLQCNEIVSNVVRQT